ncbi:hypothetical protein HK101_005947 [Irineochytrium annulatum]|nr:hypothetical protein HK101_005947 [Irineochytrium annulatum]
MEADTVVRLVKRLRECVAEARIFVAVVHRAQRRTIWNALAASNINLSEDRVDTVERMQGDEADVVIVCLGFTDHVSTFERELAFCYDVSRLNVGLSRPKSLVIVLGSASLFSPPLSATLDPVSRAGVEHLLEYLRRSVAVPERGLYGKLPGVGEDNLIDRFESLLAIK